jgi:hypothetical protein
MCLKCPARLHVAFHLMLTLLVLDLGLVHSHVHLLPGHIPHVVLEIILQDGGYLHDIEPHLDLRQGKEFLWLHHHY